MHTPFKSEKANHLFNVWANGFPASEHELDYFRFAEMVLMVLDEGESLEYNHIENVNGIDEDLSYILMNRYHSMKDMYSILSNSGRINQ